MLSLAVGLLIAGIIGAIGTDTDVATGAFLGLWLGGIISMPWALAIVAVISFKPGWTARHPFIFAACAALVTFVGYGLLSQRLDIAVAITCAVSAVCYMALSTVAMFRKGRSPEGLS